MQDERKEIIIFSILTTALVVALIGLVYNIYEMRELSLRPMPTIEKPEPDATHVYPGQNKTCDEYKRFNELGFRDNVLICEVKG